MSNEKTIWEDISQQGEEKSTGNVGNVEDQSEIDRENSSQDYKEVENSSENEILIVHENSGRIECQSKIEGRNALREQRDLENNGQSEILTGCEMNGEKIEEKIKTKGENASHDHKDHTNCCHCDILKEQDNERGKEIASEKEEDDSANSKTVTTAHDKETTDGEIPTDSTIECDLLEFSSVMLLRGTISELEHALRDSRTLLKTRDEEIVTLRKEVEKGREQVHKEQMKWQRKCTVVEERNREIHELKRKLRDSEKAIEELQERIKEYESPFSESDDVFTCCSSMKELVQVKMELAKKEEILEEIRKNNCDGFEGKELVALQGWMDGGTSRNNRENCDQPNQLKLKFLRDAFFYFMIDFHSEEQIKAILAVLAYGDQREDVIQQAYRMRQRGKKFSVKKVSSRDLSFLHEEM